MNVSSLFGADAAEYTQLVSTSLTTLCSRVFAFGVSAQQVIQMAEKAFEKQSNASLLLLCALSSDSSLAWESKKTIMLRTLQRLETAPLPIICSVCLLSDVGLLCPGKNDITLLSAATRFFLSLWKTRGTESSALVLSILIGSARLLQAASDAESQVTLSDALQTDLRKLVSRVLGLFLWATDSLLASSHTRRRGDARSPLLVCRSLAASLPIDSIPGGEPTIVHAGLSLLSWFVSHSQMDAAEELLTVACELAKQKASPSAAYTAMGMMPTLLKAARKTHADATRIAMLLCNGMAYTGPLVKSPLLPATCNAAVGELMEERLLPSTLEQRAKESFDANQQKNAEWLLCDPKTQAIHPMTVHKEWTRRCAEKPVLEL